MLTKIWKEYSSNPLAEGYTFAEIGAPSPTVDSIRVCRKLCKQNLCGCYDTNWGCPPGSGDETECLAEIKRFRHACVAYHKFEKIDLNDKDLIADISKNHQELARRFCNHLRKNGYEALAIADGGCMYCGKCSYPNEPCRFPEQRVPSISGFGIDMGEYMKSQNIPFSFEKDSMTLYAIILYNPSP